jgi:hypothetical protein
MLLYACLVPCVCRYFYISILYNVCYTLALYGLILFWNGASELLQPFNPLLKFVLVKTVVFLTFWQVGQLYRGCLCSSCRSWQFQQPQSKTNSSSGCCQHRACVVTQQSCC